MPQMIPVLASIIISVRNDERISLCLKSIFERGCVDFNEPFEVIVVENSERPVLGSLIREFPVHYLVEPRRGMGYAREVAISRAKGIYLVFTDADCVVSERWLRNLLAPFRALNIGIVGGPISKYMPETPTEKYQRDLVIGGQRETQYLRPIYPRPYVVTANAAYRTMAVRAAGGIDPTFFSGGDVDLAWRVGDLGYDVAIAPDALVYHACRSTLGKVFRQFHTYSIGHALLFKKFKNKTGKRLCVNSYPFLGIVQSILALAKVFIQRSSLEEKKQMIGEIALRLIEYVALIIGALTGAIKHKVLYI